MIMSQTGLTFITLWEEMRLRAFRAVPTEVYLTIGFGHYGRDVLPNQVITVDQAYELLRGDVAAAEAAVNKWAHPSINQAQFDALVDHVYNNGPQSIEKDNIPADFDDAVRRGNWPDVRARMGQFINGGGKPMLGLKRRVTGRQALFDGKSASEAAAIGRAVKSL